MALLLETPDSTLKGIFEDTREDGDAVVESDVVGRLWKF